MGDEDDGKRAIFSQVKETAAAARSLLRGALKASLATLSKGSDHPYASLVLTATDSRTTVACLADVVLTEVSVGGSIRVG